MRGNSTPEILAAQAVLDGATAPASAELGSVRFAEWSPDGSRAPSILRAILDELVPVSWWTKCCIAAMALTTLVTAAVSPLVPLDLGTIFMLFWCLLVPATALSLIGLGDRLDRDREKRVCERLAAIHDGSDWGQTPVGITVRSGWRSFGQDTGFLSAEEGFLFYGGERTSFSFPLLSVQRVMRSDSGFSLDYWREGRRYRLTVQQIRDVAVQEVLNRLVKFSPSYAEIEAASIVFPPTARLPVTKSDIIRGWARTWALPLLAWLAPIILPVALILSSALDALILWPLLALLPWALAFSVLAYRLRPQAQPRKKS